MWIFITAVFLVVVWLLYRRPEQTRQGLAKGLVVVFGVIVLMGVVALISSIKDEQRSHAEQAELAKVVVKANYDANNCTREQPLHVNIKNCGGGLVGFRGVPPWAQHQSARLCH